MDVTGEVPEAIGLKQMHDVHTPEDMVEEKQREGQPYRAPNFMARRCLEPQPPAPNMTLDRPGPSNQGRYNRGQYSSGPASNNFSVNGLSPMVIAQNQSNRREVVLRSGGGVGNFMEKTTTNTLQAEDARETVSVDQHTLEEVTELVNSDKNYQ